MKVSVSLAGLAAAGSLLALVGCSTGPTRSHLRFVAVHNAYEAVGLGRLGPVSEGSLGEGQTVRLPMDLEAQCYAFGAFGGDGARDVDLAITDANNARLAADTTHDAQASVQFCAPTRGHYTVSVRMASGSGTYTVSAWRGSPRGAGEAAQETAGASGPGTCGAPIPIQLGQTVTGDTRHGQSANVGECLGDGTAHEIVYVLTLDRRLQVTAAAEQDYDGALYIRRGTCDDPQAQVPGACNDDDTDTRHSRVVAALDPGTYFIFADGYGDAAGSYTLSVTGTEVPSPQEVCQNATVLTAGQALSGQMSASDPSVFEGTCAGRGGDHVYRLTVPQESRMQLYQESDYDGVLYVRRACAEATSEVACNDDAEDIQHSRINTVVPAGTYFVFSDAYNPQGTGNFTLEADLAPLAGGSGLLGDTCQDAQPLTAGQVVEGNTFQAHDDIQTPCGAPHDGYDVVYRLDVAARSRVRLWLDSSDLGPNGAAIFLTRSCAANAPATAAVGCRAGVVGENNALDAVLDRGQYFVVVDGAQPRAFGRFRLHARVEDQAQMDRVCRSARVLHSGQHITGTTAGDSHFSSSCAGGSQSAENLYRIVLTHRSFVRLAVTSMASAPAHYDPSLYIRATCADAGTERACNDDAPGGSQNPLIETELDAGTYTVFVDGFANNNAGPYTLDVTISAPRADAPAHNPPPAPSHVQPPMRSQPRP